MAKIIEISATTREYREGSYTEYETIYTVTRNDGTTEEVYSVDAEMQKFMKEYPGFYIDEDTLVYTNPFSDCEENEKRKSRNSEEPSGWTADIYSEIFELA